MINFYAHLVIGSMVFAVVNIILFPFAYLKTCIVKIKLAKRGVISAKDAIEYILIGMFYLFIFQYYDLVNFIKWSLNT